MAASGEIAEGRKRVNLSVTEEAAAIMEKYAGARGRGDLVSALLVEYDARRRGREDLAAQLAAELREIADRIEAGI